MIKRALIISIASVLILSALVLAAGSSTVSRSNENGTITSCEDIDALRDRIKCRFDNPEIAKAEAYRAIEEACKSNRSATMDACQALYNRSERCYSQIDAFAKKRCFLNESGININAGGTFRAAPDETKRNYVVLLLYELQERIEKMQEEDKITSEQASSLVTKIVEIKKMILEGESRANIIVKINEFKQEYRSIIKTTGTPTNNTNNTEGTE